MVGTWTNLLQALLQRRVVRILLFKLCQQHLHILQLAGFLPVIDQQHPGFAIGRVALDDFFQLALGGLQFLLGVQGGGQVVAVILVCTSARCSKCSTNT